MTTAFRPARRDDLDAIIALLADDGLGRGREAATRPPRVEYLDAFAAIEADPDLLQLVAVDGETVIGTLQIAFIRGLTRLGATRGLIEGVRVDRARRGQGVGEAMMREAIALCRARGCALVQLTTDKSRKDAHRFYERLGFAASHEGMKMTL